MYVGKSPDAVPRKKNTPERMLEIMIFNIIPDSGRGIAMIRAEDFYIVM